MSMQESQAPAVKLTDWANEPTLGKLMDDYRAAKPPHDAHIARVSEWNDLLKVRGQSKPKKVNGRSSVQPKLVRRQAEWRYSSLAEPFLNSHKLFQVKPSTWEDADAARQNEMVLNYQFRNKLNRIKFVDDFVRSTVDDGTSIIRLGWLRRTVKIKQQVPVWTYYTIQNQEQAQALQQAVQLKQDNPEGYENSIPPELKAAVDYYEETQQAAVAQQTGTTTQEIEQPIENRPTVEVMDLRNVIIDPSCQGDLAKAKFIIVSFETSKADLLAEGKRYKNLDAVLWDSAGPLTTPDHETRTPNDFQFNDALRKRVVAYEYWGFWDIHNKGELIPFVATWIGNVLIRMELNPFPDQKLPFVLVPYLPVKRELYGEPDAELLEDNQKILGALMRGMIDLLGRSANAQQGFAKGMLDPLNRRRYDNGQDYEFNPNLSPAQGLITHQYPELPQSALMMLNLQNQDAEALSGVKSFSGGISGESYGDVAAGIRGALDAASKREMNILRRLAQGMVEVGNKIAAMNAEFLSDREVIRITNAPFVPLSPKQDDGTESPGMGHNGGPKLEDHFATINREDLAGNFDLDVDISTAEVDNAQSQDLAFMLQTLGNTVDVSITLMILAEICRLKRMPELEHKLRTYQPKPDPITQALRQAELDKAMAEVEELRSRIRLNDAKAQEASAGANQKALDAHEQANGIEHARNIDLQEGQAQGNKELAVTKALTTPRKPDTTQPDIEAAIGYNQLTGSPPKLSSPELPLPVDNLG